ncbi:MAG: hypothetical protein JO031_02750 [Ktedonobacteraceae bacterium]|nr:hypothetical protein [Ktedonobacteraceae bacterium]
MGHVLEVMFLTWLAPDRQFHQGSVISGMVLFALTYMPLFLPFEVTMQWKACLLP